MSVADTIEAFAKLSLAGTPPAAFPIDKLIKVEGSQPQFNPIDIFKLIITEQVSQVTGAAHDLVYASMDIPKNTDNADLCIATPRLRIKGNPVQLTQDFIGKFVLNEYIASAVASGPFMNFKINHDLLKSITLTQIHHMAESYGTNDSGKGKHAIVEFSSPNIAKPFHAGHLRSTIIGNFTRNALKANGWHTTAINYLGDWGKQYGLLAVGFARHGDEDKLKADPIRHLFDVYVQINKDAEADPAVHDEARAYFKKMEDGDKDALALWQRFRDLSIVKYKEIYGRLGVEFDVYSGESQVGKEMDDAMEMLKAKEIVKLDDGAQIIDLKKDKLGIVVVQKRDGTTLYITRDIGAAKARYDQYKFDAMHYVVGAQQDMHFRQLFKVLNLMGYEWAPKCNHINFGMVNGMSTRKGTAVFLEDMLNQTQEVMLEVMKKNEHKFAQIPNPDEVADLVGLSAIVVQDMSARRVKDYDFAWDRMFSFEGDTGPYLQYAHARLCSIERKAEMEMPLKSLEGVDFSLLNEPTVKPLVHMLAQFPDLVRQLPANGFEPCNVVTYLFKLCHAVSSALDTLYVVGREENVKKARMLLYWSTRVVLGNGLKLIGLRPLERM
ncbi:arginyl-tRNA synthetase [Catenaria anguillulae PL171]|uniref:arginine--tRNA ligase n=1 Tax=Catenaria anguillulae PL171 TaxID=765915 RepID=A0A1Y2H707_9FUNG|nr:arginyl-tRNA synthetase [Catenaria anguillulae PL171]